VNEVLRQEKKYLIGAVKRQELDHTLRRVLAQDPHNGPDGYRIRSLYFDTLDDDDFRDKDSGVETRRKLRLRTYGPDTDFAMLEMKQKQGDNQLKRSLRLSREDAIALTRGRYEVLLRYSEPFAAECYSLMVTRCYRPRGIVEYRRRAYIAKENRIRITFDDQIRATESSFDLFDPNLTQSCVFSPGLTVLEVKYNGFLLSYIKNLLRLCNESQTSVSKYNLSRALSMHYVF